MTFDEWFAEGADLCHYTWTYEALYKDVPIQAAALAADVLFDESRREFTVSSETGGLNYTITIRGNLTDGITTGTQDFVLEILPGSNDFVVDTVPTAAVSNRPPMIELPATKVFERTVNQEGKPIDEEDFEIRTGPVIDDDGD